MVGLGILDRLLEGRAGILALPSPPGVQPVQVFDWRNHIIGYEGPAPTIQGAMLRLSYPTRVFIKIKYKFRYGAARSNIPSGFMTVSYGTFFAGETGNLITETNAPDFVAFGWLEGGAG